jgi:HD-GYP domain-containing protein (c-di-GMP phosphodiesterase class II)
LYCNSRNKIIYVEKHEDYGILIVFNNFPAFLKTIKLRWIEMRRISISCLKPGMKLGSPIYNSRSDELLVPGVTLTDTYICRLRDLGLSYVWIEDEVFTGLEVNEVVSLKTRIATIRKIRDITMNTKVTGKLLVNPEELYDTVNSFISEIFQNKDAIFYLSHLYSYDDYIFSHSVNVCIMALMTGITLGYRGTKLTDLGVGALLHDLGKIKIPENIINKPGKLTVEEFEIVKMHTSFGYELIKEANNLRGSTAIIALHHHENYDGSGYPSGIPGEKIPEYVQVVGIADRFDAIASDRIYRKAYSPNEAFEMCAASGNYYFKENVVNAFLYNIAVYPRGAIVELNDGSIALVLDTPRGYPLFPRVQILCNRFGREDKLKREVSLVDRGDLYIVRILNGDEEELLNII